MCERARFGRGCTHICRHRRLSGLRSTGGVLRTTGGHEEVFMNSIERAIRMRSAGAEGCAVMSRLVGRLCYRADPDEVAW